MRAKRWTRGKAVGKIGRWRDTPYKDKRQWYGEMLYPLIYDKQPHLAGKLTGMLLCQNFGVLRYALDHEEYLDTLITEGLSVLAAGQMQASPPASANGDRFAKMCAAAEILENDCVGGTGSARAGR